QRKAKIASGRLDPGLMRTLGSIVAPMLGSPPNAGAQTGNLMAAYLNSSIDQQLTIVESRRSPLKDELLVLYQQRTTRYENGFAVWGDGQERQYVMEEGSCTRSLMDGPGPCEQPPLRSLQFP